MFLKYVGTPDSVVFDTGFNSTVTLSTNDIFQATETKGLEYLNMYPELFDAIDFWTAMVSGVASVNTHTGATTTPLADVLAAGSTATHDMTLVGQVAGTKLKGAHVLGDATVPPTIAAGAAAGASPTVAISGSDTAGNISPTTGTSATTGILVTVTFGAAYASAPTVILTPANAATAQLAVTKLPYVASTTTTFTVNIPSALADSTAYKWYYAVIG